MDEESKINDIHRLTGSDARLAKLLLDFTGGDIDGVINILESVDKNIFIIRVKFIAKTFNISGSFILVYNMKFNTIDKIEAIVTEDSVGREFDFTRNWYDFYSDIFNKKAEFPTSTVSEEKLKAKLTSDKAISGLKKRVTGKSDGKNSGLEEFFSDIISELFEDLTISLKIKTEKTDILDINRRIDNSSSGESENKSSDVSEGDDSSAYNEEELMFLDIAPELSPIDGTPITELKTGDLIGVKIKDDRDIAKYISALLHGTDERTGRSKVIFASVDLIEITEAGIFFVVKFGPGIYGKCYFAEDVKIKVHEAHKHDKKELKKHKKVDFFNFLWFFSIGAIIISVSMLLYLLLS